MNKGNKQLFLNIVSSLLAFLVNTGIQFIITPIITKNIGDDAYGFITLANDFVSYASIFAVVLNSVAGRFISVEFHKGNKQKAEEYYSSIFVGNIIISIILAVLGLFVIVSFQEFLDVPSYLMGDVRILFAITFANYILSVMISVFTVSTFVKNRLDINGVRNIISYLIKLLCVIILFSFIPSVKVYFLAVATFASTLFLGIANESISKKIMPEIRVKVSQFKPKLVGELLKTGAWMTINNLSNVLANNFTTLILNVCVGATLAGFFAVAKTVPNCANSLVYALYSVFVPTFMKLFAEDKMSELQNYSIRSMKIMTGLICVPLIVLCVKSFAFLSLWQSYRTSGELSQMSAILIISVVLVILYTPVLPISQLGLTANKIGPQMINNIFISAATLASVFVILKFTSWGLIGIAASATVIQGLKWLIFTPFYAAYVLKVPKMCFFIENLKLLIKEIIITAFIIGVSLILPDNNWIKLIITVCILCAIGYGIAFLILLNRTEKRHYCIVLNQRCLVSVIVKVLHWSFLMKEKIIKEIKKNHSIYKAIINAYSKMNDMKREFSFLHLIANIVSGKKCVKIQNQTVLDFISDNNISRITLEPVCNRNIYIPRNFPVRMADELKQTTTPEIFYAKLENAILFGENNTIVCDGKALNDKFGLSYSNEINFETGVTYKYTKEHSSLDISISPIKIQKGIMLVGEGSNNFYHWVFDLVSRVLYLDQVKELDNAPFLIDRTVLRHPTCLKILEILNTKQREIIPIEPNKAYNVAQLHYFSPCTWSSVYVKNKISCIDRFAKSSFVLNTMRSVVKQSLVGKAYQASTRKRIFIVRPVDKHKRLKNEAELLKIAQKYGFEPYEPSEYSFEQQVVDFNNVDYVIAASGAALVNIMWCHPKAEILCFSPAAWNDFNYSTLAHLMEVKCDFMDGTFVEGIDHVVDENDFELYLKQEWNFEGDK